MANIISSTYLFLIVGISGKNHNKTSIVKRVKTLRASKSILFKSKKYNLNLKENKSCSSY